MLLVCLFVVVIVAPICVWLFKEIMIHRLFTNFYAKQHSSYLKITLRDIYSIISKHGFISVWRHTATGVRDYSDKYKHPISDSIASVYSARLSEYQFRYIMNLIHQTPKSQFASIIPYDRYARIIPIDSTLLEKLAQRGYTVNEHKEIKIIDRNTSHVQDTI
jgi:hypothetical protein